MALLVNESSLKLFMIVTKKFRQNFYRQTTVEFFKYELR